MLAPFLLLLMLLLFVLSRSTRVFPNQQQSATEHGCPCFFLQLVLRLPPLILSVLTSGATLPGIPQSFDALPWHDGPDIAVWRPIDSTRPIQESQDSRRKRGWDPIIESVRLVIQGKKLLHHKQLTLRRKLYVVQAMVVPIVKAHGVRFKSPRWPRLLPWPPCRELKGGKSFIVARDSNRILQQKLTSKHNVRSDDSHHG